MAPRILIFAQVICVGGETTRLATRSRKPGTSSCSKTTPLTPVRKKGGEVDHGLASFSVQYELSTQTSRFPPHPRQSPCRGADVNGDFAEYSTESDTRMSLKRPVADGETRQ